MEKTINIRMTFKVNTKAPEDLFTVTTQELFEACKKDLIEAINARLEGCQRHLMFNKDYIFEITDYYIKYRVAGSKQIGQYNLISADAMESAMKKLTEGNYNFTWDELFQMNKAVAKPRFTFGEDKRKKIRIALLNMLYVYSNR